LIRFANRLPGNHRSIPGGQGKNDREYCFL